MIETFKKAFSTGYSGYRGECNCGREFHHPDKLQWDFEDSELEYLEENSTECDYPIQHLEFDRRQYVTECDCWHGKAERLMLFLEDYRLPVAKYMNAERARKIYEAEQQQIVDILSAEAVDKVFDDDIPF